MKFASLLFLFSAASALGSTDSSLAKIIAVGAEGQGNEAASEAWKEVVKAGPSALLPILAASGKGSAVADNWLRLAANTIADQAKANAPIGELEAFLKDAQHSASARQLAFDLIQQIDPAKAETIEPTLLADPSQELRRGAVQRLLNEAKQRFDAKDQAAAKTAYAAAFEAARDEDQVKAAVDGLEKLGESRDIAKHFGFLMKWNIIGPFTNANREGYNTVFPPEKQINLAETYDGKDGKVKWQPYETTNEYGKLDFNKPLGGAPAAAPEPQASGHRRKAGAIDYLKEVTAYAATDFVSPEERDAEIRLGCKNGWKVWVNGEFIFARDEYHRGAQLDQYRLKVHLKKGANTILVKCCQDGQKEDWTVEWEFQLRVCDSTGTALIADVSSNK